MQQLKRVCYADKLFLVTTIGRSNTHWDNAQQSGGPQRKMSNGAAGSGGLAWMVRLCFAPPHYTSTRLMFAAVPGVVLAKLLEAGASI